MTTESASSGGVDRPTSTIAKQRRPVASLGKSPRPWAKVLVALAILALYAFAQPWSARGYVTDVEAATLPAWHFVETGSLDLTDYRDANEFFIETPNGVWTNRSPGIVGFAVLAYAVTKPVTDDFENWPGTAMAVLTSWLAVMFVAASADKLRPGLWLVAAVLFGLGTATWGPAANQLNPHGPAQLAVALGIWFLIRHKDLPAGLSLAVAVLVRPIVVILGIGMGVTKAIWDRSLRPLMTIGLPSLVAAGAYLAYSRLIFGSWSPTAAYEAVGGFWGVDNWFGNIVTAFLSPRHGVLVWSAWIAVGIVLIGRNRATLARPEWLVPLVAGVYIVVHSTLEVASGGLPYNYRYPLEAVTFAAPFLLVALPEAMTSRTGRVALIATGAASLTLQAMWTLTSRCGIYPNDPGQYVCVLFG